MGFHIFSQEFYMDENRSGILVLLRHGQSRWNLENRFTGWVDVELTEEGIKECKNVASELKSTSFHKAYTSNLKRAWKSLDIILAELNLSIPVSRCEAMKERHYGILQGMNKDEARIRFGDDAVARWRRGFFDRPPSGESLFEVSLRVVPFFETHARYDLERGQNVIIVAHGNSLRALVRHIENLGNDEIEEREIPFAAPLFYSYKQRKFIRVRTG